MPLAPTKRRGFDLNCRFAVNGIQKGPRSLGTRSGAEPAFAVSGMGRLLERVVFRSEEARLRFELPVRRERHPEGAEIIGNAERRRAGLRGIGHGTSPREGGFSHTCRVSDGITSRFLAFPIPLNSLRSGLTMFMIVNT